MSGSMSGLWVVGGGGGATSRPLSGAFLPTLATDSRKGLPFHSSPQEIPMTPRPLLPRFLPVLALALTPSTSLAAPQAKPLDAEARRPSVVGGTS